MSSYRICRRNEPSAWSGWRVGRLAASLALSLLLSHAAAGQTPLSSPPRPAAISATFSIVAVDPSTGICGAAVASKYPAVGKVVPLARGGVGAFCTQHYHVPEWRQQAIDWLSMGVRPEEVLTRLLRDDPRAEQRQLAIIDAQGRSAVHQPTAAPAESRYWGAMQGRYYCCQGNTLAGRAVVTEMARAYEETEGSLADRLVAALIAADRAGGDHRGRLAAGLRVAKPGVEGAWLELDVDQSGDAVEELLNRYRALQHPARGAWDPR